MTTTDERLERYLHDRSTTIDLPHAGVEDITRRARRHRRRRTAACGGVAAVLLAGGVAVALVQPAPDAEEEVGRPVAASVVDSPLEWSVVPVERGLGWGSSAVSDGSAVYSLSTAAGAETEGSMGEPRRLYRSADGTDWDDVGLPDGLYAAGVTAADGSVYAVGTAAAGGEATSVELAVSGDGGAGWDTSTVPVDLAALADGFPGRVRAVDAEVAVTGDTTVVAVSIAGTVDPAAVLPADVDPTAWYQQTGGLARPAGEACASTPGASTTAPVTTTAPASTAPPTTAPPAAGVDGTGRPLEACEGGEVDVQLLPWAELGLTPEQVALAEGQTHLFVTGADGALEPVEVLAGASWADPSSSRLLAADDGWWLITEEREAAADLSSVSMDVVARHSVDGRAWTAVPVTTGQSILAAGVVGGRPVVLTIGPPVSTEGPVDQPVEVSRIEAGGGVTTVDVNELLDIPADAGIHAWGVGPLGVAVVLGDGASGQDDDPVLVTSLDGVQYARQPLPDPEPGTRESINGITITPDAVKVRLNVRDASDPVGLEPAIAQRLFVGTPEG